MALAKPTILGNGFSHIFLGDPAHPAVRFVQSTDPGDIARVVIEVMMDPDLRRTLGTRGERFVRQNLSWSRAADQTLEAYRVALGSAPVRPAPTRSW
jgi:glycosyltransferase involved in cell wall biosynthesis